MAVTWNGEEIKARIREGAMRGVVRGTELLRTEATNLILSTQKSGKIYRRGNVEHQASAPGEPPASDTGQLVGSIETVYDFGNLSGRVNFGTEHAAPLEFGTKNMEPRPYARPALANRKSEVEDGISAEIRAALK